MICLRWQTRGRTAAIAAVLLAMILVMPECLIYAFQWRLHDEGNNGCI